MKQRDLVREPLRVAAVGTFILLAGALFHHSDLLQTSLAGAPEPAFDLTQSWGYLVLAPLCRLLDMLTLLDPSQHLELWACIGLLWIAGPLALRWPARWREPVDWARAHKRLLSIAVAIFVIYTAGGLLPRTMEALAVSDPDLIKVDFHSHTQASHDGRPHFSAEDSRAWHRAAGFDAAYISDHGDWKGVDEALKNNPALAGQGTVLLEAREFSMGDAHVIGLGDRELYKFALANGHFDAREATKRYQSTGTWPVMIFTIPGAVGDLADYAVTGLAPYSAVEISDGAPRGLAQGRRDRKALMRLAVQYDLSLIASSNNHGWGRTAPAWTVLSIPGWRRMTPAALSAALQRCLADDGRRATVVVERRPPAPISAWYGPPLILPQLAAYLLTTLTMRERFVWILYLWIGAALLTPKLRILRFPWRAGAPQVADEAGAIASASVPE